MNDLMLEGTFNTPTIEFKSNGIFNMKGRILSDNAVTTFAPLFEWLKDFKSSDVCFSICLDYINTSATMQLYSFLKQLEDDLEIERIKVIWHYEEDDDDHLETGEFYEDKLNRVEFEYILVRDHKIT